jgi:hypothetical protein
LDILDKLDNLPETKTYMSASEIVGKAMALENVDVEESRRLYIRLLSVFRRFRNPRVAIILDEHNELCKDDPRVEEEPFRAFRVLSEFPVPVSWVRTSAVALVCARAHWGGLQQAAYVPTGSAHSKFLRLLKDTEVGRVVHQRPLTEPQMRHVALTMPPKHESVFRDTRNKGTDAKETEQGRMGLRVKPVCSALYH